MDLGVTYLLYLSKWNKAKDDLRSIVDFQFIHNRRAHDRLAEPLLL